MISPIQGTAGTARFFRFLAHLGSTATVPEILKRGLTQFFVLLFLMQFQRRFANNIWSYMVRHHEIRLISRTLSADEILRTAIRFGRRAKGWEPHPNGLHKKGMGIGAHCMVVHTHPPVAGVAIVADHKNPRAANVTNIIPKDLTQLNVEQYNGVAERFAADLRRFVREQQIDIRTELKVFRLSLETAIPSPRCRKSFHAYLQGFPRTFHPCDIENLDLFICAIHRFRGHVDTEALVAYLVEQHQWSKQDAGIVRDRICVGLAVLETNRRF